MRRLCFVVVLFAWPPIAICAAPRTEWRTAGQGETVLLFPHQSMSQPEEKRVLSFIPLNRCALHHPQWVSIRPRHNLLDMTLSSKCVEPPTALMVQYTDLTRDNPTVTVHHNRITFEDDAISLKNIQASDTGLYTLISTTDPTRAHEESIFLHVVPPDSIPQPLIPSDLESGPGPQNESGYHGPHPTPTEETLNSQHTYGVTVSLVTPNSLLFREGSSFHTDVNIYPAAHDTQEYSLDIVWAYHPMDPRCGEMHIYESCLHHPHLPECMYPANAACSIGTISNILGIKQYMGCSADDTPPNCPSTSKFHTTPGLTWLDHSINLQFTNASRSASGVYLCVVYIDEHVSAWGYIVISTAEQYRNVVVEPNLPVAQLPAGTEPPPLSSPPRKIGSPSSPRTSRALRPLFYLLGVGVGLTVVCILAGVCLRSRSRRTFSAQTKKKSWSNPHYVRVAREEELDEIESSDSEFEQNTTGVGRRYAVPNVDSVPQPQERTLATPNTPAIYLTAGRTQHTQRLGSKRGGPRTARPSKYRSY
ncbi:glycoprotein E [Macropodid alphaherpesvirus 1]|uniref:Envelope glycoprotein E n=1 Tax=Macropodid alphaherpesvirus 1 TaxID=137443 RepID=A0A0Y0DAC9_9ALPH|nr:glycoprotein E [Macropodid alphaherpesvirus 1]AMB17016.1 glycoprotein E [Macropodid alphaherpesvirus 1]